MRDQAIDILWPDLDADAANAQFYKAIHHVRKAFAAHADDGEEWIEITDNLVRMTPSGELVTDIQRFEIAARAGLRNREVGELENAASMYAVDFLPMDRYMEWASFPREHYRQLYLDVLTALAQHYEEQGFFPEAAERLRQALEKEPTLETAHRGLMRIFARNGQVTRAFHQYEVCREVLREELGVSPSPETVRVLDVIREGHLSGEPEKPAGILSRTKQGSATPMIGRTEERGIINHMVEDLGSGNGSTLIVYGEAGGGKTRLIQELIVQAKQKEFSAYMGQAEPSAGNVAYGPFIGLINEILHIHPELKQTLPTELGRLIPGYTGNGKPIPHADKLAAKGCLFAQVHRLFSLLSEKEPVTIIIEDLHNADQGSRELLAYLIKHRIRMPILFAVTLRKDEGEPVPVYVRGLQNYGIEEIELTPFTYEEHVNLLHLHAANAVIGADTAGYIYQLAEGNPFCAIELLKHYTEEGQSSISINPEYAGVIPG